MYVESNAMIDVPYMPYVSRFPVVILSIVSPQTLLYQPIMMDELIVHPPILSIAFPALTVVSNMLV